MPVTDDDALGSSPGDGRSTRWEGHRTSRRAELVRGARRAVHHRGPDASMDDIATEIGTSKSILYRYFTDKTGLQTAVGQSVLAAMGEALEEAAAAAGGPRERIAAMVGVYLEMVDSSPNVYTFVTRAGADAGELRGFAAEVADLIVDSLLPALGAGEDADPQLLALAQLWAAGVVGLVRGAADRWLADRLAPDAGTATPPGRAASAEDRVTGMDRGELTAHLTNWLWDGAVGVARRARRRG